ncbi:MAG: methyltransferase [Candidatus Hodarchaeales archaeon]|jgi:SAM-dependent methyltransferase
MDLPKLKNVNSFSKDDLAILGTILKKVLWQNPVSIIFSQDNPNISVKDLNIITEESINILLDLGLIQQSKKNFKWLFLPILGEDLVFFRDLPKYTNHKQFVWLKETSASGSWRFARSLPVKKGTTILDLGTGAGISALIARKNGGISVGIDINPRAIELASLNRDLNGLEGVIFRVSDWKDFVNEDFDVIVSQPPFDPNLEGVNSSFAFDGGGYNGLEATKVIIDHYMPKYNQILALYIHTLENDSQSYFRGVLKKLIGDTPISINLEPQIIFNLQEWWEKFKLRRVMNPKLPLPACFQSFTKRVAYFVYLTGST